MAGVRLHHPIFAGVTYVVELPTPYPKPYNCLRCHKAHDLKSIHLVLDAGGNVIVSPEVYDKLKQVHLAGLELVNEVPKPPDLVVGAVGMNGYKTVEHHLDGQKDQTFHLPGTTKYESRDRMWAPFEPAIEKAQVEKDRKETAMKRAKRSIHILGRGK